MFSALNYAPLAMSVPNKKGRKKFDEASDYVVDHPELRLMVL